MHKYAKICLRSEDIRQTVVKRNGIVAVVKIALK